LELSADVGLVLLVSPPPPPPPPGTGRTGDEVGAVRFGYIMMRDNSEGTSGKSLPEAACQSITPTGAFETP